MEDTGLGTRAALALTVALLSLPAAISQAFTVAATPRRVTNSTNGQNTSASINKSGKLVVFVSNVKHENNAGPQNGSCGLPPGDTAPFQFDFDCSGNDFASQGVPPEPVCLNCDPDHGTASNLYLWRRVKKAGVAANSIEQITFTTSGGLTGNAHPDIAQRGDWIAWESNQDHASTAAVCSNCENADGNREIFLYSVRGGTMQQVTFSSGGSSNANRSPSIDDRGEKLVFDSNRDFSTASCTLLGGGSCANGDGNSEIMLYLRSEARFLQITNTTGNGNNANIRPRISSDGSYAAFQSTRDLAGAGLGCTKADGSPCANDGNGEIYLVDLKNATLVQATDTPNQGPCSGNNPNERVELSRRGKVLSFQSKCEEFLDPAGCGACNGNDELFLYQRKKKNRFTQVTISQGGFNRVPRVSGSGSWVVFESTRNYMDLNSGHRRVLYIVRNNRNAQLVEDGNGPTQNTKTRLVTMNLAGGFNSSTEGFGVSTNGRFVSFDNSKSVGNVEIWFLDRKK